MVDTASKVAPSDYDNLIKQGILDAKGSIEDALAMLTPDDLVNLGRTLADRAAKINDLFSVVVEPINNLKEGIDKGHYTSVYDWISNDHSRIPLTETTGGKRIYFVPVTENVNTGEEEAYVNKFGLTLCKKAPNYLLGAMSALPENKLPENLKGKDIVAAENEAASVFQARRGRRCFLHAHRSGDRRLLALVSAGIWYAVAVRGWVFLAEKPE